MRCRRAACAAAFAVLALAVAAPAAETGSTLEATELERLLEDLDLDSGRLLRDAQRFLQRSDRWEPTGADRDLWRALESFERAAHRTSRLYAGEAYPGMERDLRELLEEGWEVERELDRAEVDRRLREDWGRIRGSLQHLARSHGWEYGRSAADTRFGATGRTLEPDERQVRELLLEVDRRAEALASRLGSRRGSDSEDVWKGLGESILRDVTGLPSSTAPGGTGVDAEVAELRRIAAEARRELDRGQRVRDLQRTADSLRTVGRRIGDALRREATSDEAREAWSDLRTSLDRLAALYGLEPL